MSEAKSRPDFSGAWEVNFEKSIMRGPSPKRILMRIEHQEPKVVQRILFTSATGSEQRLTFTYETGAETANSIGGVLARTHARWEERELVIESWMKTPGREVHFKDYW